VNTIEIVSSSDQLTVAGQIVGGGSLQKTGPGQVLLTANNTYGGGTLIKNGTISLGGGSANQYGLGTGLVTLDGGTLAMFSDTASYDNTYWNLLVPAGSTGTLFTDDRCNLHGTLTGSGTLNFNVYYVRTELNGNWSAFTGQINVGTDSGGGDFRVGNNFGYPNASINLANNINAYRKDGGAISIGAVSGGSAAVMSGATAWTVGAKNTDATFNGTITGNSITKVGTGRWTLTGANTYTGPTIVSGGTLIIDGNSASATGTVTVGAAGTLGGTGLIGGNTTVNGTVAPGASVGTLTFNGTLTLAPGGKALMEINRSSGTSDLVEVAGALTYGGTLIVTNLSGTLVEGDSFKLFNAGSYGGAFTGYDLPPLDGGRQWDTSALAGDGTISVTGTNPPPPFPTNGPVARYAFEGNALDFSGNNLHGTPVDVTYVGGTMGVQAAHFNGTSASVQIPRSIGNTDFTIALWVKTTDTGSVGNGHWWNGNGLVDGEVSGGRPDFGTALVGSKFSFGVGTPDVTVTSSVDINDGQWHHLAATRELGSGQMAIYVDGVPQGTATGPAGIKDAPPNLRIGSIQTGTGFLNGAIDDVMLFDSALDEQQITQLFDPPRTAPVITNQFLSDGNLVLAGEGGPPYWNYNVLTSTNVSLPVLSWARMGTNQFDSVGHFIFTNTLNSNEPRSFLRLEVP